MCDRPPTCALGEGQELCVVSRCDWDGVLCNSTVRGCACPPAPRLGLDGSVLALHLTGPTERALAICAALALVTGPLVLPLFRWLTPSWPTTRAGGLGWPRGTAALFALFALPIGWCATTLPATVWGGCERRVCVYHEMFCEATRHQSLVRHPANFHSNFGYVLVACYLLAQAGDELRLGTQRLFAALDALFGVTLLSLAIASFLWHGSNCSEVHFVDIGLMNSVIAFFPLRYAAMAAAALASSPSARARASALGAGAYAAVVAVLLGLSLPRTATFAAAFPTGRARSDLTMPEIFGYVAAPALYPIPSYALCALQRRWGHLLASQVAFTSLSIAFAFHAAEKLALDLGCAPMSWVQPTAVLHGASAVTMAAAYVHARSMDATA